MPLAFTRLKHTPRTCTSLMRVGLLVASVVSVLTGWVSAEPPSLTTRQKVFEIPFTITAPSSSSSAERQPSQVQLMVSGDRGRSWQLYQQRAPSAGKFAFQAGPDGEFWFHVRTLGPRGQLIGPPSNAPELKVLVDTDRPLLELESGVGPSGAMQAQWRISDSNLDISTFALEFRSDSSDQWQRVAVDYPQDAHIRDTVDGQAKWWPTTDGGPLTIRGQVQDRAGNVTVVQRRVESPQVARSPAPVNWLPPINTPPTNNTMPPATVATTPAGTVPPTTPYTTPDSNMTGSAPTFGPQGLVANNPFFQTPTPVPPSANAPSADRPTTSVTPNDTPWVARRAAQAPVPHHDHARSWQVDKVTRPPNNDATGQPPEITALGNNNNEPSQRTFAQRPNNSPGRMVTHGRQPGASRSLANQTVSVTDANVDPNNIRVSKSRRFRLDYDVEAVGDAGVARIELWATRNGGQTWQHYGDDPDKMSPFMVTVDQDGLYGYRLVIQANQGLAMRPPENGDSADVWIAVDATSPTARITSAKYGSGTAIGQLQITWEASDQNLEDGPITLSISPQVEGPWTPIAEGIENTGSYSWQAPSNIPRNVYLRLQVRDKAANVTEYRLRESISSDGLAPRGRIRSVAPAQHLENKNQ